MEKCHHFHHHSRKPTTRDRNSNSNNTFSSSLLDAIYRSIDNGGDDSLLLYRSETMRRKNNTHCSETVRGNAATAEKEAEMASLRRAIMIEKWMEKKVTEKLVVSRTTTTGAAALPPRDELERSSRRRDRTEFPFIHSSSSSSESSCGGGFSSSEAESLYGANSDPPRAAPKAIRTSAPVLNQFTNQSKNSKKHDGDRSGGGGAKAKALKIYGDLKKVKQPISPGAKLAGFLNSLFNNSKNIHGSDLKKKKPNMFPSSKKNAQVVDNESFKSANASTCSSASSFSRSCLSKTPSSTAARGKTYNTITTTATTMEKRSVRFSDEDLRNHGHNLQNLVKTSPNEETRNRQHYHVGEIGYPKKVDFDMREVEEEDSIDDDDDDDDEEFDDSLSCASSDLFELDSLSAVGRYQEELPVYETTHLGMNRAIASGLVL